jgi:uncharacterized protein YndB with AHSA1/START domain
MAVQTTKGTAKITLPADNQIVITRQFNAPKHLVYRALTEADLIKRWWGAGMGEIVSVECDARVGGAWRNVQTSNGFEVGFHGEFREIVPNERIVYTEIFEGMPDGTGADEGSLITASLDEVDARTTLTLVCEYASQEVRDTVIATGMETGMQSSYDALEEVAAELAA